jgi:hypothetical protein
LSTLLYARTTRRAERDPLLAALGDEGTETPEQKQSELAQKLAALVPAEVLVIWGAVTASGVDKADDGSTTIVNPTLMKWCLIGGAALALLLYVIPKLIGGWAREDLGRMIVPPFAFLAWTLVTGSTAHTLWGSPWDRIQDGWEWAIGGAIGAIMIALSGALTPKTTRQARADVAAIRARELAV